MEDFQTLDCEGLSTKLILELADELRDLFDVVDVCGDEISLSMMIDESRQEDVRAIIKRYGVRLL